MKEIKFRCWSCHSKNMQDWDEMKSHGNIYRLIDNPSYLLMQFTGLKDKNGVDIYEGDIVKWGHIIGYEERLPRIAIVEMKPALNFRTINLGSNNHKFHYGCFAYANSIDKAMEVIGNIHQNKELLTSEEG